MHSKPLIHQGLAIAWGAVLGAVCVPVQMTSKICSFLQNNNNNTLERLELNPTYVVVSASSFTHYKKKGGIQDIVFFSFGGGGAEVGRASMHCRTTHHSLAPFIKDATHPLTFE